jgi:hypothetical protein
MTSIQANQDRQDAGHAVHAAPVRLDASAGCDQRGRCVDPDRGCSSRVPVLLMTRGAIESLRAVEMKSMALSADDVRCMVDAGRGDDGADHDDVSGRCDDEHGGEALGYEAGDLARQLALSF